MNRGKELVKNSLIITIGKIATQFISFFLLPLYTAMLSTDEYGMVDLFATYVQLLLPFFTLFIEQGAFRFLLNCDKDSEEEKGVISGSFWTIFLMMIVWSIGFTVFSPFIKNGYKQYMLYILLASALSSWALQIARGLKSVTVYTVGSFLTTAVALIFNVFFIVILKMGVKGMLIATVISNLVCYIYIHFKLQLSRYLKIVGWDLFNIKKMLQYSIPLIPNQVSVWVMNSSDRAIVNIFLNIGANGILAVSHKFAVIFSTIFSIFQLSWQEMGALHYFDSDRDIFFTVMFDRVIRFFSAVCICLIAIIPWIFGVLINESFYEAYDTIPLYLIGVLFNIMVGLLGVIYIALKKTFEIAKTTMLAACINIVIHVSLIRFLGLYAAALSTLISFFIVMVYRMADTKKYINIRYNYLLYFSILIITGIVSVLYYIPDSYLARSSSVLLAGVYSGYINKENLRDLMYMFFKRKAE